MNVLELKGVITKDQLLEKVKVYEDAKPLEVELGEKIQFDVDKDGSPYLLHQGGQVSISPATLGKLTAHIGFPRAYLNRIPKEERMTLVKPHLDYWYRQVLAGTILRFLIIDDNAIDVIPKANFAHIKISTVIDAVEEVLGKSIVGFHKTQISPSSFKFSVLTPREVEVAKDHIFNAGVRISHSMTGESSTSVAPYLFNQYCSNGATTEHELAAWKRRNQKEDLGGWLQRTITEAHQLFDGEVNHLRELCKIKVDSSTSQVLDSVLSQSMVPGQLQTQVRNKLIDDGAKDLYDIYNILTNVDTHGAFEDHPNSQGILDKVAAHLACHSKLCPTCHKQMDE